jgi:hypothetical protein
MLTFQDEATIRNAIWKRLHEPGKTEIADIQVVNYPDDNPPFIRVDVWFILKDRIQQDGLIDPRSHFDLPHEFEHSHLLNEIDEIAEQLKFIRKDTKLSALSFVRNLFGANQRKVVSGTGLRGRWPQ